MNHFMKFTSLDYPFSSIGTQSNLINYWLKLREERKMLKLIKQTDNNTGTHDSSFSTWPWFWWWVLWLILLQKISMSSKMVRLTNQTKRFFNKKKYLRTKWTWKVDKRNRPSMVWYKDWRVQDVAHNAVQHRTVGKTSMTTVQCINQIRIHHDRTDEWTIMHNNQVKCEVVKGEGKRSRV